jgi:hypothetical protein
VLGRLRDNGIKCHRSRVRVRFPDVDYLGHKVVPSGTALRTIKVKTIVNVLPPTNIPGCRAVLETANCYRKVVKDYSTVTTPLNNLLRENVA